MNGYVRPRRLNRSEEIFGNREFEVRGMERKILAELVGYGNTKAARFG